MIGYAIWSAWGCLDEQSDYVTVHCLGIDTGLGQCFREAYKGGVSEDRCELWGQRQPHRLTAEKYIQIVGDADLKKIRAVQHRPKELPMLLAVPDARRQRECWLIFELCFLCRQRERACAWNLLISSVHWFDESLDDTCLSRKGADAFLQTLIHRSMTLPIWNRGSPNHCQGWKCENRIRTIVS